MAANLWPALRFALHHAKERGLIASSTSSLHLIIDQNAKVVRDVLEPEDAPAGIEAVGAGTPRQPHARAANLARKGAVRNWDAPVIYTTMVQLCWRPCLAQGTRVRVVMHQLSRAVLVFDEVQTLPVKCAHLFNNAMNFGRAMQHHGTVMHRHANRCCMTTSIQPTGSIRFSSKPELMQMLGNCSGAPTGDGE